MISIFTEDNKYLRWENKGFFEIRISGLPAESL